MGPSLVIAITAFLATLTNPNTLRAYRVALDGLADELGENRQVADLDDEAVVEQIADWFTNRWGSCAPATFNLRLDALRSATSWWRDGQHWLTGDPTRRLRHRPSRRDRLPVIARPVLEAFLSDPDLPLRERTLYRLLYDSAARAQEALGLDVEELDRPNRRAPVRRKGGAADIITWRTGTARLLPRLLEGRTTGPVFLTHRRARVELPPSDLDPTGQARLSYRSADHLLATYSADQPGGPWNLHQLRHAALSHAAEDGASAPMLMALSGHVNIKSVAIYTRVSAEALGRWQGDHDPARRRR